MIIKIKKNYDDDKCDYHGPTFKINETVMYTSNSV